MKRETFEITSSETEHIESPQCIYCGDYIRAGKFLIRYSNAYFCDHHSISDVLYFITTNVWTKAATEKCLQGEKEAKKR